MGFPWPVFFRVGTKFTEKNWVWENPYSDMVTKWVLFIILLHLRFNNEEYQYQIGHDEMCCIIWYQFWNLKTTLLKLTLLYVCFLGFLNCKNVTKSRNPAQIIECSKFNGITKSTLTNSRLTMLVTWNYLFQE